MYGKRGKPRIRVTRPKLGAGALFALIFMRGVETRGTDEPHDCIGSDVGGVLFHESLELC